MSAFGKPSQFIREVRAELTKVAWSTRQEVLAATGVVIATTFVMAIFIGILDLFLSKLLSAIFR
jgi:preprotein translocase subunit SecE